MAKYVGWTELVVICGIAAGEIAQLYLQGGCMLRFI